MISYIKGEVLSIDDVSLLILTNNLGFQIQCSQSTLESTTIGSEITLFVETSIIQESSFLFVGFRDFLEKKIYLEFRKRTSVNRKSILNILNHRPELIINSIKNEDTVFFSGISGIGKKTAENIIVTMKDSDLINEDLAVFREDVPILKQAFDVLKKMGFGEKQFEDILKDLTKKNPEIMVEDLIKETLIRLSSLG